MHMDLNIMDNIVVWICHGSLDSGNLKRISYGSQFNVDMSWISHESLNSGNLERISHMDHNLVRTCHGSRTKWIEFL